LTAELRPAPSILQNPTKHTNFKTITPSTTNTNINKGSTKRTTWDIQNEIFSKKFIQSDLTHTNITKEYLFKLEEWTQTILNMDNSTTIILDIFIKICGKPLPTQLSKKKTTTR
jgi:hypothetical protein